MGRRTVLVVTGLLIALTVRAEQITGRACYHYSDNESILVARDIAYSLAKRNALEGYIVFVQSSATVENYELKNDLIASIAGGFLRDLKIIEQRENAEKHEVCRGIKATVEPVEIKEQTIALISTLKRQQENKPTGLPESEDLRIVKVEPMTCTGWPYSGKWKCLVVTTVCKKYTPQNNPFLPLPTLGPRITWFDKSGVPDDTFEDNHYAPQDTYDPNDTLGNRSKRCGKAGDVLKYYLPQPPKKYTYQIDIPE